MLSALAVHGGSQVNDPVAGGVPLGVGVVALIGGTAVLAGVGGVTHLSAGGSGHVILVVVAVGLFQNSTAVLTELILCAGSGGAGVVPLSGDSFQIAGVAPGAVMLQNALAVAGGVSDLGACVPVMAQSISVLVHIGLAAALTGVDGAAAGSAGGGDDGFFKAVGQNRGDVDDGPVAADGALLHGVTGGGAGGGDGLGRVLVLSLGGDDLLDIPAVAADLQGLALVLAVGLPNHHGLVIMAGGLDIVPLVDSSADGAEVAVIAQGGAGGVQGVQISVLVLSAVHGDGGVVTAVGAVAGVLGSLLPEPDVGDSIFSHADVLIGVGGGVIHRILTLLGEAGRCDLGAAVGAVAVADLGLDAGLGNVRDQQGVGLTVHLAVVVGHHALGGYILGLGISTVSAGLDHGEPLVIKLAQDLGGEIVTLQGGSVGVDGAEAELTVVTAVHRLGVVHIIGEGVGDFIVQVLNETGGAVIEVIDILAVAIQRNAGIGVYGVAGFAHGLSPVIPGVGGVLTGRTV